MVYSKTSGLCEVIVPVIVRPTCLSLAVTWYAVFVSYEYTSPVHKPDQSRLLHLSSERMSSLKTAINAARITAVAVMIAAIIGVIGPLGCGSDMLCSL
jgi:hypothetical protein